MTKLYCLQRDRGFNFYELEAENEDDAQEEVEAGISTNCSSEWIITEAEKEEIKNLLNDFAVQTIKMDLNEEMIKYENENIAEKQRAEAEEENYQNNLNLREEKYD